MATLREIRKFEALKFANAVRVKLGRKPVTRLRKGEECSATRCPIARTIGGQIWIDVTERRAAAYTDIDDLRYVRNPFLVGGRRAADFIEEFDDGNYPELVVEH